MDVRYSHFSRDSIVHMSIGTFNFWYGLSVNRLSFGGGKYCVSIGVNFGLVWKVLQYDLLFKIRLRVCVTVCVIPALAVTAELS